MIRVAVAGVAHQHAAYIFDELIHHPDVHLVAVADADLGQAIRYAGRSGVPIYSEETALLAEHDIDVVATAAVFGDRGRIVANALRAGADVLADKPLCTRSEELDQIEALASERHSVVSLMLEKRSYPVTLALRQLARAGVLGDLAMITSTGPHTLSRATRPRWFFERESYGGILCDLAVHDLDLVLLLTGMTDGVVSGFSANVALPEYAGFADHGVVTLQSGPVLATIDMHYLTPIAATQHDYRMRVVGTRGTAEVGFSTNELVVATHERGPWRPRLPAGQRPAENFFSALATGQVPEVATAASVAATRLALAAQRSADAGGEPVLWSLQG